MTRGRRGLTLIEAVVSMVLVAVMLVASLQVLGTARAGEMVVVDVRVGHELARDLLDEITAQPYADETVLAALEDEVLIEGKAMAVTLGKEAGEELGPGRSLFDDVDDYDMWSASPPQGPDGKSLDEYGGYTRQVRVDLPRAGNLATRSATDQGVRLVTVRVLRGGAQVAEVSRVVTIGATPMVGCTLPDGSCMDLPRDVCAALGGASLGTDTSCVSDNLNAASDATAAAMIAHWEFEEGSGTAAADSVGSHDGLVVGASWDAGAFGGGLSFDSGVSSDDQVVVADHDELDLSDGFTITAWVELDVDGTTQPVVCKGWGTTVNYWIGFSASDELYLMYTDGGAYEYVYSGLSAPDGDWSMLSVSVDGGDVVFSLNGVDATVTKSVTLAANTIPFVIGRGVDTFDEFSGYIDDVRVYGTVLTPEELDEMYLEYEPPAPSAPVFGGYADASEMNDVTSITLALPSGTGEGDLLIAAVAVDANGAITPPAGEGWAEVFSDDHFLTALRLGVWWKIAGASESATHRFTWGSGGEAYGWMMRFTGHDPDAPIHRSNSNSGALLGNPTAPSVTTTIDNCLILRIGGFDDDDINPGAMGLSGHTPIVIGESGPGNGTVSGGAGYVVLESAGSAGTAAFNLTSTEEWITVTIAVAPDPGG